MGGGLAFLTKKNFNPANWTNQKAVWEARQKKAHEEKAVRERQEQLKVEKEDEQFARVRGGDHSGDQAALKFMYGAPPGLDDKKGRDDDILIGRTDDVLAQGRNSGDDDAAVRFRMLFATTTTTTTSSKPAADAAITTQCDPDEAALQGYGNEEMASGNGNGNSKNDELDTRTALEKAVGRRAATGLSLNQQIERFPQLKNAPMAEGMAGTNVHVTFKPLGGSIRNIRCLKCGEWGHSKGERVCKLSGWNPFQLTSDRISADNNARLRAVCGTDQVHLSAKFGPGRTSSHRGDGSSVSSDDEDHRRRRHRRSKKSKSSSREKKHKKHSKKSRKRRSYSRSRSPSRERKLRKQSGDDNN